jgi:hypothetical protein
MEREKIETTVKEQDELEAGFESPVTRWTKSGRNVTG